MALYVVDQRLSSVSVMIERAFRPVATGVSKPNMFQKMSEKPLSVRVVAALRRVNSAAAVTRSRQEPRRKIRHCA